MASVKCPHCGVHTVNEPVVAAGGISVVECRACHLFFAVQAGRAVWPLTSPPAPDSVPEKVREAYEDARRAHAAGANIAALMAGRTVLTRFLRDKEAASFKDLVDKQIITPAIYGGVDQLRLWAAIAGHEDIEIDTFDSQEVEDILDYLATALEAAYTLQARVNRFARRTTELKGQSGAGQ